MKLRITLEGKTYEVEVDIVEGETAIVGGGYTPHAYVPPAPAPTPRPASAPLPPPPSAAPAPAAGGAGGGKQCKAPLAGTVTKVLVAVGDTVQQNQTIMVMEAMKMETNVAATCAGTVSAVRVASGTAVREGDVLVELA